MKPTSEQEAILEAVRSTDSNLCVVARAGAAKTTTLCMIAEQLPRSARVCSLAFNRAIAREMQERLPQNCDAMTLNGLGHRAVSGFLGRRPEVDKGKGFRLVKEALSGQQELNFSSVLAAVRRGKAFGWMDHPLAKPLISTPTELDEVQEENLTSAELDVVVEVLERSAREMIEDKVIDFDDQILGAACLPVSFDHYDVVLVDEAQDLSAINHKMLKKLARRSRVIAVGDPLQAIYAFRGARVDSMEQLAQSFNMTEHRLTVTFRCPQEVVSHVQDFAPDMRAAPGAPTGTVKALAEWSPSQLDANSVVLCRFNAPLFRLAIKMLLAGQNVEYVGHDVLQQIERAFKTFPAGLKQPALLHQIDRWQDRTAKRRRNKESVADQADCMRILAKRAPSLSGAQALVRKLRRADGRIKLMTIHKAKGLEFDKVYILKTPELPGDQEENLKYVARTRARSALYYIEEGA